MRRVLSLLLTVAMMLSLLVVAGAEQQTVTLKTAKSVNGSEVTYTFTLDATGTKGVGALSFDVKTTNLTFKANSDVYNEVLDTTFRPGVAGVQDGSYGFHTETNRFVAYGGDGAKDGTRLLKDSVQLVSLTYTIDDATNYSLEVTEFKACYSGAEAMTTNKYNCEIAPITDSGSGGLLGDVNGDGSITAADMQRLYNHLNGTDLLSDQTVGDINRDGSVTAADMQRLYSHLNGTNPLSN